MNYMIIKCGGSVLDALPLSFYENIVDLHKAGNIVPIIVHGGGPIISSYLKKHGVKTSFVQGLRVTTDEVLDVVEMALSGSVNKKIVRKLNHVDGNAYGISGVDGGLLTATKITGEVDLGFVGEVTHVKRAIIDRIAEQGYIPVLSPLALDTSGQRYNINADMAASAIAQALGAKLCFISDIPGIYTMENGEKKVFRHLSEQKINQLINEQVIYGGMIPKVQSALKALSDQVPEVAIINGKEKGSIIQHASGKSVGTKITLESEVAHIE
ncbi:acetylglutamate kinase [Aquibacillus sp. 3ASR75-11]|uniref:Acetylglutamate kinase n=1 Tax=Terrihalobacillus insolitus TaxID=2950438 RepID=A0A9X3WRC1_9BACI|nr:acetylglutamate kinase [Terrihalobacillus insolitus]MDC3424457.1 acetylglutamate kinase [Terrihalobacillus insolitus]